MNPAEHQELNLSVDAGGALVIAGEIDIATCDGLSAQIRESLNDDTTTLVIDLAGVEFMDSSGLRLLLEINESCAARDVAFVVRNPSPAVRRLLEMTGLTRRLSID